MRILSFVILGIVALYMPLWVFIGAAVIYSFVYTPYELLGIAVVIDAQFGHEDISFAYWYTTSMALLSIVVTLVKPALRLYSKIHDVQDF